MKCLFRLLVFLFVVLAHGQKDYSSSWKDYFPYNYIVDFTKNSNSLYAITENAAFIYNQESEEIRKVSSVDGLSGENTSAIYFDADSQSLVIGYETGLIEIVDENGRIRKIIDITVSEIATKKSINQIIAYQGQLIIALDFGIVSYSLEKFEFGDTYFIGAKSTAVKVNDILIFDEKIYAITDDGIYIAQLSDNLNNSNNWIKQFTGEFSNIVVFDDNVCVSRGTSLFQIVDDISLDQKVVLSSNIIDISTFGDHVAVLSSKQAFVYDTQFSLITNTVSSSYTLTSVLLDEQRVFMGSQNNGVLNMNPYTLDGVMEIHPDGPASSDLFSITVKEDNIWCVYGGIAPWYGPLGRGKSLSHFNGKDWVDIKFGDPKGVDLARDLLHVTVDPNNFNKVYVSSWSQKSGEVDSTDGGGVLILENDQFSDFWNAFNTNLGDNSGLSNITFPNSSYTSTRAYGSSFDDFDNFWIANSLVRDGTGPLKKRSFDGVWTDHPLIGSNGDTSFNVLEADTYGNIWIGSKSDGMFVYNEHEGNGKGTSANFRGEEKGIPNDNVRALAVGSEGNVWIGTQSGVVLFSDVTNVFSNNVNYPEAVIIDDETGASRLLDGILINDIKIDGAGNVWFATASGGVLQTDSTGRNTLQGFNKDNSPLPSNNVISLGIDNVSGVVYFGTEKGIVSFKAGVVSYGEELSEIYAYPNPALESHDLISIVGKDANLPRGTNIKILDVAGNLVFESNATLLQSAFGGKFVWNKRNLSGSKVASGVYIVLMFNADGQQTASTKIAIIN
jgi:hypothetical protein